MIVLFVVALFLKIIFKKKIQEINEAEKKERIEKAQVVRIEFLLEGKPIKRSYGGSRSLSTHIVRPTIQVINKYTKEHVYEIKDNCHYFMRYVNQEGTIQGLMVNTELFPPGKYIAKINWNESELWGKVFKGIEDEIEIEINKSTNRIIVYYKKKTALFSGDSSYVFSSVTYE